MSSDLTLIHRLVWFNDHETLEAHLNELAETETETETMTGVQENSFDHDKRKGNINSSGTSPINRKFRGLTPIHLAIQLGHLESVKVLIKH